MGLSQYPASSRSTLKVLVVLCITGFIANGTMVGFARQAQVQFKNTQQDDTREMIQNTERVHELQKRVDALQQQQQDQKLEVRVTRLEAIAETNHALLITVTASIAVLLLETALRLMASLHPLKRKVG